MRLSMARARILTMIAALGMVLTVALVAPVSPASADEEAVIYVASATGDDDSDGTADAPVQSLEEALARVAASGGRVVIMDDYPLNASVVEPEHTADILVTSSDGETDYPGRLLFGPTDFIEYDLSGPTTFADLGVVTSHWAVFEARWNPITFGEGMVMESVPTAGKRQVFVTGGYHAPTAADDVFDADSFVTIDSGTFYKVAGFTRAKGVATQTYTGTSHLTLNGGIVQELFGASIENHYSGSSRITMTGGRVGTLHTAGDATRYITGDSQVELSGGHINLIDVNNVVHDVDLTLSGVDYDAIQMNNRSASVDRDAEIEEVAQVRSVEYAGQHYTAEQIATLRDLFDVATNIGHVHVTAGGTGTACTQTAPCGSLAAAVGLLAGDGGTISLSGDLAWDVEPTDLAAGLGRIVLDGAGAASIDLTGRSELEIGRDLTVTGVLLENSGALQVQANGADLVLGEGTGFADGSQVSVVGLGDSAITIGDGEISRVVGVTDLDGRYEGTTRVAISGGTVGEVWAGTDQDVPLAGAVATISGGAVGTLYSSQAAVDTLAVRLLGGTVQEVQVAEQQSDLQMRIGDAETGAISVPALGDGDDRTLLQLPGAEQSTIDALTDRFGDVRQDQFVYVAPGGDGDGVSPDVPVGDLGDALAALVGDGHVVLTESYTIADDLDLAEHTGEAVLTSDDGDIDFAEAASVALQIEGRLRLGGPTVIDHLVLQSPTLYGAVYAMGHPLTITEDVTTELSRRGRTFLTLVGGRDDAVPAPDIDLVVSAGEWESLRGGTDAVDAVTTTADIDVEINGGVFHAPVVLGHRGTAGGEIDAVVNDGRFLAGLYAVYEEDGSDYGADYDIDLVVNGGEFWGMIAPAKSRSTVLDGSYAVTLNGGEYAHLTDIAGAEGYAGAMTSTIEVSPSLDLEAAPDGEITFTNSLTTAADPYMFTHEGMYYFLATSGSTMALHKVANPSDLSSSVGSVIFAPDHLINLWSPEIHHLTAAEVGEEYAGWYLYLSASDPDDGAAEGQRQYVLKALDGDDLLGRWGNPVTGEVNEPIRLTNVDNPDFNTTEFVAGTSTFRVGGETYISFVTEKGRGTSRFHQEINLSHMVNPWTLSGEPSVITVPEYDWEMHGYVQSSTDPNMWWPKVVEGATAVYGQDGEVFMAYSASGYWTPYYAIGYLRYTGGDPMDAASWLKNPTPILSQSSTINGTGTGPTFTDHEGNDWFMFQARPGTSATVAREAFIEPYTADADGLSIGDGSGHPAALSTEYTMSVNPIPLGDKISGFTPEQEPDTVRPEVTLVSPSSAGPMSEIAIEIDATDEVGLQRIVANIYSGGTLVKSTQTAIGGARSGSHTATVTLPDGEYTIRYNAQDLAGNISVTSTVEVRVDATAPTVTVKPGSGFTIGGDGVYEKVSFKLFDAGKIARAELNGHVVDLIDNTWSDLNFVKPGTFGAVEGENTLTVYDVAGNAETITFTLS